MDELTNIVKALQLDDSNEGNALYDEADNPNKLPINQVHLTKTTRELRNGVNLDNFNGDTDKYFEIQKQVIPALHKSWLPKSRPIANFQPYNFAFSPAENLNIVEVNQLFLINLNELLSYNYHQFWCFVLFEPQVCLSLHSFILHPILPHVFDYLEDEEKSVFKEIYYQYLLVYRRLITFKESETEYMSEDVGLKFLLEKKLINLPVVITLILLYEDLDREFINKLIQIYHKEESVVCNKEIEETLSQILMTLEMIGGHICGFELGTVIVPIAIEKRPSLFSLAWVYSVVNYLYYTVATLNILLKFYKSGFKIALEKGIPYRLSFVYEKVYFSLYDYLENRPELDENPRLTSIIFEEIALGRCDVIDVYNAFISNCLDNALKFRDNSIAQQEVVETYLQLLTAALEDEFFITDYHEKYNIGVQNEMFASCTDLDETRSSYILDCINSFRRHKRLTVALRNKINLEKTIKKYAAFKSIKEKPKENGFETLPSTSFNNNDEIAKFNSKPKEHEIEEMIKVVIDMFPHLGDGFVLKCLEVYNYQPSEVITAILEENVPPHILDIPFDTIRIPPEPEPEQPILKYKGKKPGYDDALKLLNDKKDIKEIKTYILDGIQYTNEYDVYDDEYDDRLEEEIIKVPDYGTDILTYNPNHEDDAVSDISYSENEYDDDGKPVDEAKQAGTSSKSNTKAFCEDPAVVRERREAARRNNPQRRNFDVVGKPKGQGQEKDVLQNRQKKKVNKSSKANHNRKGGAQWKRNRGMMPS